MSVRRPAKVPGRCADCGAPFDEGALILWYAGSGDFPSITYGPCWPDCKATVRDFGNQNLGQRQEVDERWESAVCSHCGEHATARYDRGGLPPSCTRLAHTLPAGVAPLAYVLPDLDRRVCGGAWDRSGDEPKPPTPPVPGPAPALRDGEAAGSTAGSAGRARTPSGGSLRNLHPQAALPYVDGGGSGGGSGVRGGAPDDLIPPGGEGRQS